jgi:hypothetical protein
MKWPKKTAIPTRDAAKTNKREKRMAFLIDHLG